MVAFLLGWLRSAQLQRKSFFEERDGSCRLMGEFAVQLSETSKIWRQALGPLAEWIAHTLWSSASRTSGAKAPATRLTQNRKRGAKGIPIPHFANPLVPARTCLPVASPEISLAAMKKGRLNRFDPVAQLRRAESQRRQASTRKAWNPAEKPDWLDEKAYREKVQPRLLCMIVPRIMSALAVSESYALRIRAGRCIPHPRYWVALAQLTSSTAFIPNP